MIEATKFGFMGNQDEYCVYSKVSGSATTWVTLYNDEHYRELNELIVYVKSLFHNQGSKKDELHAIFQHFIVNVKNCNCTF